jgi:methionine synthase II (cobalamin-independent)
LKNLDELQLATADVGSLPLPDDFENDKKNVDRTITDKTLLGLDYPCYPQLTGTPSNPMNMGLQFLIPLSTANPGISIKGEEVSLLSEDIKEPISPIGIERAEYYLEFVRKHFSERLHGLKACVTGPFTLASYFDSSNIMACGASKPRIISALANVLSKSCRRLSELGFDLINIDEPFLSLMLGGEHEVLFKYDENFVVATLNSLIKEISCFSGIHVCGTVTPMVKSVLLATDTDVVDHEFATCPRNLQAYTADDLDRSGKLLAYGCVSSITPRVESVQEIGASIRNALRLLGPRIMLKPDCGFAGMQGISNAYTIALQKLKNMVEASRELKASTILND